MKMCNPFIKTLTGILSAAFLTLVFSCNNKEELPAPSASEPAVQAPYLIDDLTGEVTLRTDCDGDDIHWEYEGPEGPDHWPMLCDGWACDGKKQSPVNIIPPLHRQLSKSLKFYWKNTATSIVNNGHTIQYNIDQPINPNDGSYISLNGQKYYLLQFHFHAKSEHTVNGEHYPVEIHFVHRNPLDGKLAVVGVFVEEGDANPFFNNILETWPHEEGNYTVSNTYNPNVLMPAGYNNFLDAHFWWYNGSLTTPPCSEIVNWMVWSSNIEASHEQIEEMESILHENYRPTLPLGGSRLVKAQ
ncbi:MAG: carbonic anhydrase family protein [Saprospiraceae bacterium]|nr:carbonic anhydrase family protein [Saprospiraceae bacterium]